tara:strand:+ start:192 stop:1094 length:903 start_codon:yes stop_codon:yes gene_type:complete
MNIVNLPNDIHYKLLKNIKNCDDIVNLKNTCKTFNNIFHKEIKPIKVDLFRINIIFKFYNYDINKHEMICRKFSKFREEFNNGSINISRKTNNSIFETITLIYISVYIDNLKNFNIKFYNYLTKYNILNNIIKNNKNIKKNYFYDKGINISLNIYFNDYFFDNIKIDNMIENREDLIIDYCSNLKINNIFNKNNNLNFKDWKKINKLLNIKYEIKLDYQNFNNNYIILPKIVVIQNVNNLILECENIMKEIEKTIFKENYNETLNTTLLILLYDKFIKYEKDFFNLLKIKLKLFLKNNIN